MEAYSESVLNDDSLADRGGGVQPPPPRPHHVYFCLLIRVRSIYMSKGIVYSSE